MASRIKRSDTGTDLLEKFRDVETDGLPEFDNYDKPLEMGLWVLWVAKEKLNVRSLTANEIVDVIVSVMEVSVDFRGVVNAFNRAKGRIHKHDQGDETYYEIMKSGKENLVESAGGGSLEVFYFEPGKKHTSKRILRESILDELKGELKIVDPYCDSGTLDILSKRKNMNFKCLTLIENLRDKVKKAFLRDLKDFKSEFPNVEFRSYSKSEIHDRYIISDDKLVILGYSLKDLGSKESFALILDKKTSRDVFNALVQNFNRRWKAATPL